MCDGTGASACQARSPTPEMLRDPGQLIQTSCPSTTSPPPPRSHLHVLGVVGWQVSPGRHPKVYPADNVICGPGDVRAPAAGATDSRGGAGGGGRLQHEAHRAAAMANNPGRTSPRQAALAGPACERGHSACPLQLESPLRPSRSTRSPARRPPGADGVVGHAAVGVDDRVAPDPGGGQGHHCREHTAHGRASKAANQARTHSKWKGQQSSESSEQHSQQESKGPEGAPAPWSASSGDKK